MTSADPQHAIARSLFPDLAAQADAVAAPRDESQFAAEQWLTAQTERMRCGDFGPALARFSGHHSSDALMSAFASAQLLATGLDIACPEPEDFLAQDSRLGTPGEIPPDTHADHAGDVTPVVAPHGLGAASWLRWFAQPDSHTPAEARRHPGAALPEFPGGAQLPGLAIATEALRWFAALDTVTDPHATVVHTRSHSGNVRWTLRWIPVSQAPPIRGIPFTHAPQAQYPTLPEMLAIAAARRHAGEPLLDAHTFTWLAGELPGPTFAARHAYDPSTDTVRISTRERTDQGAHVGVRLALS